MGDNKNIDFRGLADAALRISEQLVPEWLPDGERHGHEWKALNPTRADGKVGSFSINLSNGAWGDFACDDKGGDLVSLYAYLECDGDQVQAAKYLAERLGMPDAVPALEKGARKPRQPAAKKEPKPAAPKKEPKAPAWVPVLPVPADAPPAPKAHEFRGVPSDAWAYQDAEGRLLGYVCRFTTSDGGKEVLPLTFCRHASGTGAGAWRWQQWDEPRPLFGLDRLAARPDAPVLLVEGEKCASVPADMLPEFVLVSWPGGSKAIEKVDWSPLAGRNVLGWPDCDAQRKKLSKAEKEAGVDPESMPILPESEQPGVKAMERIAEIIAGLEQPAKVRMVKIPAPGEKASGWDIVDAMAEGMDAGALKAFMRNQRPPAALAPADSGEPEPEAKPASTAEEAGALPAWMRGMIWKDRGLEECRENVFLVLTQHPEWRGIVAWDDFARRVVKLRKTPTGSAPGEWTGEDDAELGLWMAQRRGLRFLVKSEAALTGGVAMAARRNKYHPVRDWLGSLPPWDGVERLNSWLAECMGAVAASPQYLELVGRLFLVGMVARVMQPGCKWDYMPIFEGHQGRGKSTALRVLADPWFADTQLRIGDKDAYMQLDGVWLYEIGEMDSFNRSETTAVKAFVTTQCDRYREPYARRIIERARQVAFGGTTNQGEYFKDTTGNRRFWPVRCRGQIDLDKLAEWREQLFAEALQLYRAGVLWRPTREEEAQWIRPEQEAREIVDPWLVPLQDYLEAPDRKLNNENEFTSYALLTKAIGMDPERIDGNRSAATRIGNLMARLGWPKRRQGTGSEGRRDWVYVRPEPARQPPAQPVVRSAQAGNRSATGSGVDPVGF